MAFARYLAAVLCCVTWTQQSAANEVAGRHSLQTASFTESTHLIDVRQGSPLSLAARSLRNGGYELATGTPVNFSGWYSTRWTDASITWMTQVTQNFGFIFGGSTGERGEKYGINPGVKLGFLMQTQTGKNAFLSLRATTILGGELREKPCTADYGEIGGVQQVNCRLAASPLPPSETLNYLVNRKPYNRDQISMTWNWRF